MADFPTLDFSSYITYNFSPLPKTINQNAFPFCTMKCSGWFCFIFVKVKKITLNWYSGDLDSATNNVITNKLNCLNPVSLPLN